MTTTAPAAAHPHHPRTGPWVVLAAAAILVIVAILWFVGAFNSRPRVAIVTASQGPYWDLIVKGAQEAADRHGVRLDVISSTGDEAAQSQKIRDLVDKDYAGVAVSPNDSTRQARLLAELAAETNLVTFDADAVISRRLCFVGTDNYDAGRMCGQLAREAMPDGGTVIISIGSIEKENGHRRRQGVIDELLERTFEPNRPADANDKPLAGPRFTIVTTLIDNYNPARATELAIEAIKQNPKVTGFIGLFASSTPAVLKALEQTNKLGEIKVIAFDANDETIAGIEKGHVYASIVQDAYNIGFSAVRILADAAHGDKNAIPLYPTFYLRCDPWMKSNLAEMRQAMASRHKPTLRNEATAATQPTTLPAGQ
jgi:ribose transport system substrate-binding protein